MLRPCRGSNKLVRRVRSVARQQMPCVVRATCKVVARNDSCSRRRGHRGQIGYLSESCPQSLHIWTAGCCVGEERPCDLWQRDQRGCPTAVQCSPCHVHLTRERERVPILPRFDAAQVECENVESTTRLCDCIQLDEKPREF